MRRTSRTGASSKLAWSVLGAAAILGRLVLPQSPAEREWRETFATTPFEPSHPRWCERYHHAHWIGGAVRFEASARSEAACREGGPGSGLSCSEQGCDACGFRGSPCAKVGDENGNAVLMTTDDELGVERSITARFSIERELDVGSSHLGLYAAIHPHCHTTVQAILVPDRPGIFHLNLAVINEFIGGDRESHRRCLEHPFAEISPALVKDVELREGVIYAWTLDARLAGNALVVSSSLTDADGAPLASGRFDFAPPSVESWLGVPGGATRHAFGVQFGPRAARAASAGRAAPSVLLHEIRVTPGTASASRSVGRRGGGSRVDRPV